MARGNSHLPMSNRASASSRKSCCDHVVDFFTAIYLMVMAVVNFVWGAICSVLSLFLGCFEFIWYPIKETGAGCWRACGNKRERS